MNKKDAKPRFNKCRPVPFALLAQVEQEIHRQINNGELVPVEQSEWAAPIVIAKKKDGGIRICADFKTIIKPHVRPKSFPLPTAEEVFSTLSQGESFTKLDLARAFKQMGVSESTIVNKEFEKYLLDKGIHHELSAPYSSAQNGVAERINRTLMESAHAMMAQAGLSDKYWAEAVVTGTYIRNRVPTRLLKESATPFQKWYGRKPNLSHVSFWMHGICLYTRS